VSAFSLIHSSALALVENTPLGKLERAPGQIWEEPDHYTRLEAVKVFLHFVSAFRLL
jgi:hypothetical protein